MWQERVNASVLARSFPEFAWKPERQGFGWRYRGTRGDESVTVEARSVLPYGSDDDELAETRWYVYPAGESVFAWQPEQGSRARVR